MNVTQLDKLAGRIDAKADAYCEFLVKQANRLLRYWWDKEYKEYRVDLGVDQGYEGTGKTKAEAKEDFIDHLQHLTLNELHDKVNQAIGHQYELLDR